MFYEVDIYFVGDAMAIAQHHDAVRFAICVTFLHFPKVGYLSYNIQQ